jgi:poly(3-hydroxybutyrate) depolymerase
MKVFITGASSGIGLALAAEMSGAARFSASLPVAATHSRASSSPIPSIPSRSTPSTYVTPMRSLPRPRSSSNNTAAPTS